MKKGAVAATALAVGAGATGTATAQEEAEGEAVVHAHDFYPNATFTVLADFDSPARDAILQGLDEEEEVFDDPSDWNAYAIRIQTDGDGSPLGYLFEEETIDIAEGETGTMGETASFRNPQLNLLELNVTVEEAPEEEEEEEPPEEEEEEEEVDDEADEENNGNEDDLFD